MAITDEGKALNALIDELFQLNGQLLAEADKLSAPHGLTGARWQVLGALKLEARPLTVAQIARRMGLQRQSVQRLSDILVEQGILAYHSNPDHKRAKLVDLTPKGCEIFNQASTSQIVWANAITTDFTTDELMTATDVLRKLKARLG